MVEACRSRFETFLSYALFEPANCRACRKAFAVKTDNRVDQVNSAAGTPAACEAYKATRSSPGLVRDEEVLHYLVTDPQAVDRRSGKLLPGLLSQIDKKGLSVLRDDASNDEFHITFGLMKEYSDSVGKERYLHSISTVTAKDLRFDNSQRISGIYDTAVKHRKHHADVMGVSTEKLHKERRKKVILGLLDVGNTPIPAFRNGALIQYMRP
jgi:hypothetical protein